MKNLHGAILQYPYFVVIDFSVYAKTKLLLFLMLSSVECPALRVKERGYFVMFKVLNALCAAFFCVCLAGCATPYGKTGLTGGYSEKRLSDNVYRVTFSANGYTTQETAQTFWLYRAVEITLENGFDGFRIVSDMRFSGLTLDEIEGHGETGTCQAIYIPMYYDTSSHPYISGDIQLLRAPISHRPPRVFDARRLKAALDPIMNGEKCADLVTGNAGSGNVCPHVHDYLLPDDDPINLGNKQEMEPVVEEPSKTTKTEPVPFKTTLGQTSPEHESQEDDEAVDSQLKMDPVPY